MRVILGVVLLAGAFLFVASHRDELALLEPALLGWLVAAAGLRLVGELGQGIALTALARPVARGVTLSEAIALSTSAAVVSQVLPLGGLPVKLGWLSRAHGVPLAAAAVVVVSQHAARLAGAAVVAGVAVAAFGGSAVGFALAGGCGALAALVALATGPARRALPRRGRLLTALADASGPPAPAAAFVAVLASTLAVAGGALAFALLLAAVQDVPLAGGVAIGALNTPVSLLKVTPANAGVLEVWAGFVARAIGVSPAAAVTATLLTRVAGWGARLIISLPVLARLPRDEGA